MSYSMWPVEVLGVEINNEYLNCLKADLQKKDEILEKLNSKAMPGTISQWQLELFKDLCDNAAEILEQDIYNFYQEQADYDNSYQRYEGGRNSENYAYYHKLDVNTGSYGESEEFDGYVYEFSWGSRNVYEPEFKKKSYLLDEIKKNLYIPTDFDLENNIIFVTAVCGG